MNTSLGWLYHLCPKEVLGDKLIPLNRQKLLYPSLYERNFKIYAGREQVTRRLVPILNCHWNDVIHLTNIPPNEFFEALKDAGREPNLSQKWLKIPAEVAIDFPTVVYSCRTTTSDRLVLPDDEVTKFDSQRFGIGKVDIRTKGYYKEQVTTGQRILLFQGIAHFLVMGEIDLSKCMTISWNDV